MKMGRQNPSSEKEWSFEDSAPVVLNECNLPSLTLQQVTNRILPCCICLRGTRKEFNNMKAVDLFPFPEKEDTRVFGSDSRFQVSVEFTKLSVEPKDQVFSIMPGTFYDRLRNDTV